MYALVAEDGSSTLEHLHARRLIAFLTPLKSAGKNITFALDSESTKIKKVDEKSSTFFIKVNCVGEGRCSHQDFRHDSLKEPGDFDRRCFALFPVANLSVVVRSWNSAD